MSFHHLVKASIFGTDKTDSQVTTFMVWTGFVFTLCQFVTSIVQPAPYGRYAATSPRYLNCKQKAQKRKKTHSHCLKMTQNVAFDFWLFGIFHQLLFY